MQMPMRYHISLCLLSSTLSQLSWRWCYYSNIWMTLQSQQNRLQKRLVRTLCYPLWSCTQGKACLTQLILTLNYDHILTSSSATNEKPNIDIRLCTRIHNPVDRYKPNQQCSLIYHWKFKHSMYVVNFLEVNCSFTIFFICVFPAKVIMHYVISVVFMLLPVSCGFVHLS